MANTIKVKRSAVPSKVPATTDLQLGELAINTYDGKLFLKKDDGTQSIVQIGGGGGSGDVTSSSTSSTDNSLARFDGTTGKVIQNSTATLSDTGNLDTTSATLDYLDFDTAASAPATQAGRMYWDSGNGTPSVNLNNDVNLQLGQEIVTLVYNGTGSTITNGSVVAVTGAQGQRPSVVLADADSESTSASTLGIATQDIANGAEGFITSFGFVRGVNTSAFTAGAPIYLSQTAGAFTATRPSAPAHTVILGWIIKVNASSGEIFVHISNGWELDELHNVLITSPASGNTLIYDATAGVWKNANLTDGTGITITEGAGSITVANSGVLTVTGTAPVVSSGGQNPAISMAAATTSVNGYLTSTDWNTFNGKQAALVSGTNIKTVNGTSLLGSGDVSVGVTSVTGTSPIASSGGATPAISLSAGYGDTLNPYASKTMNMALASPQDANGVPTFRNLHLSDMPSAWIKRACACATTAALTLNTAQTTIDGVTISATSRVLVKNQATASQNGIYTNMTTTTWTRASDADIAGDIAGAFVSVDTGTVNGGKVFDNDFKSTDTLGTTAMNWYQNVDVGYFTTVGNSFVTLTNPSAITFPRINADNTVSALDAATFRTAIGAGAGTVTSVGGTGTVSGLTLTGTVTSSGNLTLGGNLSIAADMIYDTFTATASQTTFTTSATYTSGKIEVYCNGIKMRNGTDVTVTSGTSVVFATGLAVGSLVDLVYPT